VVFPVATAVGRIAVLAIAVAVLVGFLLWSKRAKSHTFFLGVLAGSGSVLSSDIVWIHWMFGLHHVTNAREDLVLEPLFVLTGLAFLRFGLRTERPSR
jgi:uncharacterized membrane protein